MERHFLIELQHRPDGLINSSINSYSTPKATLSMFFQRCAAAVTNTQFTLVSLTIIDAYGSVIETRNVETAYVPPEPESEPEAE